jgi:predicted nucleic acid-binding protein
MKPLSIVIDTSALVRATLNPGHAPDRLVQVALRGPAAGLHVLYDQRVLAEYRDVLLRPHFGFDEKRVRRLVRRLQWVGKRAHPTRREMEGVRLRDPSDAPFMEVAVAGGAAVIVTYNPRHFPRSAGFMVEKAGAVLRALEERNGAGWVARYVRGDDEEDEP